MVNDDGEFCLACSPDNGVNHDGGGDGHKNGGDGVYFDLGEHDDLIMMSL